MKTTLEKILVALVIVIVIYAVITTFEKRKFESKYYSEVDNSEVVLDSMAVIKSQLKDLTLKQQYLLDSIEDAADLTNSKLQEDEKRINDSVISDRKRDSIRAAYENK